MELIKIENREQYEDVMSQIEKLLKKSSSVGGLNKLSKKDSDTLQELSVAAETFEDSLPLMPIKDN